MYSHEGQEKIMECNVSRKSAIYPIIAVWMEYLSRNPSSRISNNVNGMYEFHGSNIKIHLVLFENTLCAPSLEREFPRVPLCVLSNFGPVRP
mmetsp:Transcript_14390/g.33488  ORF Transcript_14390/g.33488 Transcript_14390/m.33488 type:complete len:92 (-) Transcript_14390:370-645(-)